MIATSQKTGERVWSLTVASIQQPWVAGDNVFVVDTSGQVMAVTRNDGKIQWSSQAAGRRHVVGAGACRQPAVAHLQPRGSLRAWRPPAARWRARRTWRRADLHRPRGGRRTHVRSERQRPADCLPVGLARLAPVPDAKFASVLRARYEFRDLRTLAESWCSRDREVRFEPSQRDVADFSIITLAPRRLMTREAAHATRHRHRRPAQRRQVDPVQPPDGAAHWRWSPTCRA